MTPDPNYRAESEADIWFDAPDRLWNQGRDVG